MPSVPRILLHGLVIAYVTVNTSGFMHTMFRKSLPIPWIFTYHSYGMMAPYQGYSRHNGNMVAEGKTVNGQVVRIDIEQYMPFKHGEASIRYRMSTFRDKPGAYKKVGEQLLKLEYAKGHAYEQIEVIWESWPKSTKGYNADRTPEKTERKVMATVYARDYVGS